MPAYYKEFDKYVTQKRWMSYWHQISEVLHTQPKKVLVVGVGNGIIPEILREKGIEVYTYDNDKTLCPDFCGDLRSIHTVLSGWKFDTILCCQVLEHLEFLYFEKILLFFESIVNNSVIISLPHCHIALWGWINLPIFKNIKFNLILPSFWITTCFFNNEHKWEVGMKHYSKNKINKIIGGIYDIEKSYFATLNPYHLFYVLKKKEKNESLFD